MNADYSTPECPRLHAGDPRGMRKEKLPRRGQPATFSRFVLPFRYRLTPAARNAKPPFAWKEATAADWLHSPLQGEALPPDTDFARVLEASLDQERWQYFTRETSEVLYRRAKWFILRGPGLADRFTLKAPAPGQAGHHLRSVTVRLGPPALVLFECPDSPEPDDRSGILQNAMFVLETWFEPAPGDAAPDSAPSLDDLLVLNELFRYFRRPFERHSRVGKPQVEAQQAEKHSPVEDKSDSTTDEDGPFPHNYRRVLADLPVDWRKPSDKIENGPGSEDARIALYLERWEWLFECPLELGTDAWQLVPAEWIDQARRETRGEYADRNPRSNDRESWLVYSDQRAYTWTCAVVDAPLLLHSTTELSDPAVPVTTRHGYWMRLVNMDPVGPDPATCSAFEAAWADRRTYRRWAHFGSLQGFNYHGGAMLTGRCDEPPTWRHFGGMYFDQALLLLYLRVTLFRVSYELGQISAHARRQGDDESALDRLEEDLEQLRFDFALFTNLYQFPLLSNLQQGLELYSLCRREMDLGELFDEVQDEVRTTHEFLAQRAAHRGNASVNRLTWVASIGLVVSLALGFLGIDAVHDIFLSAGDSTRPVPLGRVIGVLFVASVAIGALFLWVYLHAKKLDRAYRELDRKLHCSIDQLRRHERD